MATSQEITNFLVNIAYGYTQYTQRLSATLDIRGNRDLANEKNKHKLLRICRSAIFKYFENPTDTTEMLTKVEIENVIEHFNRMAGTEYYIDLE